MLYPNGIVNMNTQLLPDVWYVAPDTSTPIIWKATEKNLAKNPKYAKVLAEHRAMLDDYITRSKDNYRSLKVDADPRCRNHTPGYPNHEGPSARDIIKRK